MKRDTNPNIACFNRQITPKLPRPICCFLDFPQGGVISLTRNQFFQMAGQTWHFWSNRHGKNGASQGTRRDPPSPTKLHSKARLPRVVRPQNIPTFFFKGGRLKTLGKQKIHSKTTKKKGSKSSHFGHFLWWTNPENKNGKTNGLDLDFFWRPKCRRIWSLGGDGHITHGTDRGKSFSAEAEAREITRTSCLSWEISQTGIT